MPFVDCYDDDLRIKMATIYAETESDSKRFAIPRSLERIKEELGITLPKDGRSLRDWRKKYGIYPKVQQVEVLFPDVVKESKNAVVTLPRLIPIEEFQEGLQEYAGEAQKQDIETLKELYQLLQSSDKKVTLKTKSFEELLLIKRMIEESMQKRELHYIKLTEYVDIKKNKTLGQPDYTRYDAEILSDLEGCAE
jgi:hypothetical protein